MNKQSQIHAQDEHLNSDGTRRKGWQPILTSIESLSTEQVSARQNDIAKLLRANGIAYGGVGEQQVNQRPWQLDLIPQVIESDDWHTLAQGLNQRARLKQALLSDLYSEQSVLREGILPPGAVYAHDGYLRCSNPLPGSTELPLFSTDVSRSPSGDWYVEEDICQSPDGIGYVLENRLVLARILSDLYRENHVSKLVDYYRALQAMLNASVDSDERCVMLCYGPAHPHYFEYAYLAKYLGFTLVEINDLAVRGERVWLRTVAGMQRVNVILRFVDDMDIDPLAFNNGAQTGIPGILQAARTGNVRIINPIGTGILDNPAFNAWLPELCRYYLQEDVSLLSAPTYWLGDKAQLAHVSSHFNDLLYREINARGKLLDPTQMTDEAVQSLRNAISLEPQRYIALERIDRSLTPCLLGTDQIARQVTIRSYLINTPDGFSAMAGGLCLLDSTSTWQPTADTAPEGSKDVWVLSPMPVSPDSLIPTRSDLLDYAMIEGELPSRVAENLFWVGRHVERAENIVRVLRMCFAELQNQNQSAIDDERSSPLIALLKAATAVSGSLPVFNGAGGRQRLQRPTNELLSLLHDDSRVGTLAHTLKQLQLSASAVRDRISLEVLHVLNQLDDQQRRLHQQPKPQRFRQSPEVMSHTLEILDEILASLSAFAGLTYENNTHGDGWRFMMLGRRLDRARQGAAVIGSFLLYDRHDTQVLETLLRTFDSLMTYRSRYRSHIDNQLVMQLLLIDESNPRALAFQFQHIDKHIRRLPGMRKADSRDPLVRLAITGLSRVRLANPEALLQTGQGQRQSLRKFLEILDQIIFDLSSALSANFFTHTELPQNLEAAEIESKSSGENAPPDL